MTHSKATACLCGWQRYIYVGAMWLFRQKVCANPRSQNRLHATILFFQDSYGATCNNHNLRKLVRVGMIQIEGGTKLHVPAILWSGYAHFRILKTTRLSHNKIKKSHKVISLPPESPSKARKNSRYIRPDPTVIHDFQYSWQVLTLYTNSFVYLFYICRNFFLS